MTSGGISEIFKLLTPVKQKVKAKTKKWMLRKLDVSGNKIDIGILSSLRSMLAFGKSLRFLSITSLHKFNDDAQKTIISALKKNQSLKTLDLNYTTEDFYYKLRDKMNDREVKGEIVPIKVCFKDFVKYQRSAEKQTGSPDNTENVNPSNFHNRIQDYSAKVRLFNKEKVLRSKSKRDTSNSPGKQTDTVSNSKILIKPYARIDDTSEVSEVSSMTDDFITNYRMAKDGSISRPLINESSEIGAKYGSKWLHQI